MAGKYNGIVFLFHQPGSLLQIHSLDCLAGLYFVWLQRDSSPDHWSGFKAGKRQSRQAASPSESRGIIPTMPQAIRIRLIRMAFFGKHPGVARRSVLESKDKKDKKAKAERIVASKRSEFSRQDRLPQMLKFQTR